MTDELSNPPTFHLPSDFYSNRNRYELWACRVPVKIDASMLSGVDLCLLNNESNFTQHTVGMKNDDVSGTELKSTLAHIVAKIPTGDHTYGLVSTNPLEFDTYRMLVRNESSIKEMKVLIQPFDKLLNVVDLSPTEVSETDIAPSRANSLYINDEKHQLRIPYTTVEQVQGLKRRWTMYGGTPLDEKTIWQTKQENIAVTNSGSHKDKKRKMRHLNGQEPSPVKYKTDRIEETRNIKSPKKDKKHKHKKNSN